MSNNRTLGRRLFALFDPAQAPSEYLTATDQVAERIRRAILNREFPVGMRLVEGDLVRRLGVSRGTIRAAIQQLRMEGVVTGETWKGAWVSRVTPSQAEEILICRSLLEVPAVRRAVAVLSEDDLTHLEALANKMRALDLDQGVYELVQLDNAFHFVLVDRAANATLAQLWRHLLGRYACVALSTAEQYPITAQTIGDEHEALVSAFADREPQKAADALRTHFFALRAIREP